LSGESNLEILLESISPELLEGEYVFCTLKNARYGDFSETRPVASFAEAEGLTLVVLKEVAQRYELRFEAVFRCITLGIHSSLEAVGLTAAVSGDLAAHGIAANIMAGYFHDHVFVPVEFADRAIGILSKYNKQ